MTFVGSASPRALMACLGLVTDKDPTGDEMHRRGRIMPGNALVHRLLVETAWHYQHRLGVDTALTGRRKRQPRRVIVVASRVAPVLWLVHAMRTHLNETIEMILSSDRFRAYYEFSQRNRLCCRRRDSRTNMIPPAIVVLPSTTRHVPPIPTGRE